MDITINELGQLTPDSYVLLDMRGDVEVGHGIIPGAIHMSKEEILEKYSGGLVKADEAEAAEREDSAEKKLIIYCARGRISQELAEELRDRGYDAYSLKGGYTSWLLNEMKNQQADEVCAQVEKSIRKKFRKNIWCKFTKAINQCITSFPTPAVSWPTSAPRMPTPTRKRSKSCVGHCAAR